LNSISIGKILGIPLRLHYTWFIIFVLITASLVAYLPTPEPYVLWLRIALGVVASLLFFISIVIHELAHSFVAVKNNIPVKNITLFVFGGVSQLTKEASRPTTEMLVAIVGPLASILIAGIFHGVYLLLDASEPFFIIAQWLAYINAIMALFNLIPGFPLDGGRVFRAIIWLSTGNYMRATHIATLLGRIIGYIFIGGGIIVMFVTQQWITGLWLAFIGWFLETAATISYRQTSFRNALNGFTVKDIITPSPVVSPELSLSQLIQNHILPTGHQSFTVADEGRLEGVVTLNNVKKVPQKRWDTTRVKEIMTPNSKLTLAHPEQDAVSLLEQMDEKNIDEVPVLDGDRVVGMVIRGSLIYRLQIRSELKI